MDAEPIIGCTAPAQGFSAGHLWLKKHRATERKTSGSAQLPRRHGRWTLTRRGTDYRHSGRCKRLKVVRDEASDASGNRGKYAFAFMRAQGPRPNSILSTITPQIKSSSRSYRQTRICCNGKLFVPLLRRLALSLSILDLRQAASLAKWKVDSVEG
ncbi:hypothetical protein PHSY_007264 [Pseudozyma hubeiensis SY62]|uniref:Uncharacterized protein n=1 Tax=Pseudozyma hubeiensis (strain SY62) TaxID=1305764 RepID=R9PE77_PSEHS|nr:hypothetical protein PHSY_007264 [Pseudozyma hubeiensis SY62]GAC99661.1 hypothetical protein PHSY_007264 [Pseudozyma hubeiensis SY62]